MTDSGQTIYGKSFYFMRHAQTEANAHHYVAGGQLDLPLTLEGRWQVRDARRLIKKLSPPVQLVVTSTMRRAIETGIGAVAANVPRETVHQLREQDFGEWDRRPVDELLDHIYSNPLATPLSGGESRLHFYNRTIEGLNIALRYADKAGLEPLIVAHAGTFIALATAMGLPTHPYPQNAQLGRFVYGGGGWSYHQLS